MVSYFQCGGIGEASGFTVCFLPQVLILLLDTLLQATLVHRSVSRRIRAKHQAPTTLNVCRTVVNGFGPSAAFTSLDDPKVWNAP